ncbi:aspartate aminotransferase family protein [Pararhodospirillum oryzae]|uniref:Aspartate aminotransferase family protein n=1 Tax=Pararhodospirillum oryzae TaxID=478448 RepID=A0A512H3I9_9PROT|nr:aspartate aminotransferase family protein [Pararhodospirillum oryzae]GEO79993.1 aspartate aminotransferase family protein [Pararhodospirillum oryzae]
MVVPVPTDLDAYWMPFTANRQFKKAPRLLVGADRLYYTTHDGRQVMDTISGLWCVNAGHNRPRIVEAIRRQVGEMDYAPPFQMAHPQVFELATRLAGLFPDGLEHVFFTNSGSESVETALKIALAAHRARGEPGRFRLIGRERGYHGVNFGGLSVGGIGANRKAFGPLLPGVDHLRHTHAPERNAFSRGLPEHGAEFADDLERLIALHDPSTIAAVIVEPVAGSTGVLLPPRGYLERLRALCTRHGIFLIFDEVITGFGRLGAPFATHAFGVTPDLVTVAKGLTNGVVPMGAVIASRGIHDAFMNGPGEGIEFFHGYTYSGNPIATAAALATLDTYAEEGLLTRGPELAGFWEDSLHALRGLPHVIDIRNYGLVGAIELDPIPGQPTQRATQAFLKAYEAGFLIRTTGDTIALAPPLIAEREDLARLVEGLATILRTLD